MRGGLLLRYASLDAEPASMIAGASSRGWITAHERPRRSRTITTESLGVVARRCAGPTDGPSRLATNRATRIRTFSYIRAANESLKRSSDLRRLAPLAII